MVNLGAFLSDPFTIRSLISIVAGVVTGLLAVRLTFYLRNKRDLFNAIRAIRAELEHNVEQVEKLATLLREDMQDHQLDRPLAIPAGIAMEFRYVLTLPSALQTAAFDQLTQTGELLELPPALRRRLFDLYDAIDRINRLHRHRETLHYTNLGNVHVVVDATALDLAPGETATEADLPAEVREQLAGVRRLRQATTGINRQILRLVGAICPPRTTAASERGPEPAGTEPAADGVGYQPPALDVPDIETVLAELDAVERESFWARFV